MSDNVEGHIGRHNAEIHENLRHWSNKPLLQDIYREFHILEAGELSGSGEGIIVELGSGIGNIRETIPHCVRTDIFPNPWIDRVENAYALSFDDASVSDIILTDVFHHLRYPGAALREFHRVLRPGGRVIMLEPSVSLLGLLAFGPFHSEPLALRRPIEWDPPEDWNPNDIGYFAAQGNAGRIFRGSRYRHLLSDWRLVRTRRLSRISWVAAGGYAGPQLYPDVLYPLMRLLDRACSFFPGLFATRILVTLEKPDSTDKTT